MNKNNHKFLSFFENIPEKLKNMLSGRHIDNAAAPSQKIIIISQYLPRFDQTAADLRLYQIISILLERQVEVCYLYSGRTKLDKKYMKECKKKGTIKFHFLPQNLSDYATLIERYDAAYLWVTSLWRIPYFQFIAGLVEKLKKRNDSPFILIDTIDFHYKEFNRRFEISGNGTDLETAKNFLELEKELYPLADTLIVVSKDEKKDIEKTIPMSTPIEIIPNIHPVKVSKENNDSRKHLCFVGNFGNKHNTDAVKYFTDRIFAHIRQKNPGIEFHVIGFRSDSLGEYSNIPGVRLIGAVKDIEEILDRYKLFVCPMTYGAGMKGKISMAAAVGLPFVTTTIGAEGFPVKDGEECFIADDPEAFADKCNSCLEDPVLWKKFSEKARKMITDNFSIEVVDRKLKKLMPDSVTKIEHVKSNVRWDEVGS